MDGSSGLPVAANLLRSAAATVPFDRERLAGYLKARGQDFDPSADLLQFAGGYGNLNYLIKVDAGWAVLRRPPLGDIPKGANDMGREFRALSVLAPVWPLVPRPFGFCDDPDVLGAPFLISEFRAGLPLHGARPLGTAMTAGEARDLSMLQVDILRQLHGFDIAATGAGVLGRTEGFAARTLRGWTARLDGTKAAPPPEAAQLFRRLAEMVPEEGRVSVIHNDFKLDNIVVDPATLAPTAVLDWDMATLGSPFFDLATLLSYWASPLDPAGLRAINFTHSEAAGALTRRELVEAYMRASGHDSARDEAELTFFIGLAFAKLGVVCLQLYDRFCADPARYARNENFDKAAPGAFALGVEALDGKLI